MSPLRPGGLLFFPLPQFALALAVDQRALGAVKEAVQQGDMAAESPPSIAAHWGQ